MAVVGDIDGESTLQQFREHSVIADTPILQRFGSWNDAVEQAGSDPHAPDTAIPTGDLLAEVQQLRNDLDRIPTGDQMNEYGGTPARRIRGDSGRDRPHSRRRSTRRRRVVRMCQMECYSMSFTVWPRCTSHHLLFVGMREHGTHRARTHTERFGS